MVDLPERQIRYFLDMARDLDARGLLACSCGNLSWRIDRERFLVSASRSWLGRLKAGELSLCRTADGALLAGARPSVETAFHAALLRTRPDWNVVLHHQSPAATAVTCGALSPEDLAVIPEIPFYVGTIRRVAYRAPGSAALHEAVADAGRDADFLLLENHGQATGGWDWEETLQRAVFFELACDILTREPKARRLPPDAIRELFEGGAAERERCRRQRPGTLFEREAAMAGD